MHKLTITIDTGVTFVKDLEGGDVDVIDYMVSVGTKGFFLSGHNYYPPHRIKHILAEDPVE